MIIRGERLGTNNNNCMGSHWSTGSFFFFGDAKV
jgi:hypothetical protein